MPSHEAKSKPPELIPDPLEGDQVGPSGPDDDPSRETDLERSSKTDVAVTPGGSVIPAENADIRQRGDVVLKEA